MSPIKLSKKNKPYFNLNLEENGGVRQAVCFSPTKKKLFDEANIKDAGLSITGSKISSDGTVLINESTKVKIETLGFQPSFELPCKTVKQIINEVPLKSKTNVIGIIKLEEETTASVAGQDVAIRRGYLCDDTGSIKLTLWREYAANLYNSGSYMFSSLVKTLFNNTVELQSTNSTSFKQVEDITNFVEPTEDSKSTQCTFVGAVFIHHVKCLFCNILIPMNEDIEKENNTRLVTCVRCKGSAMSNCLSHNKFWNVIAIVEGTRIDMKINSSIIDKCLPSDLELDQMKLYLLTKTFQLTYDELSGVVSKLLVHEDVDIQEEL